MPTEAVRKDDPNVKIPAAVRATAAKAAELHSQVYKKDDAPKDPPQDSPKDPPKETPAADPKTSALTDAAPKEPAAAPVTHEGNPPPPKDMNWEHAYKSMKGRHDRLQEANHVLLERVTNLESALASIQAPPAPRAPSEHAAASLLTDKERAEYGDEFLGVVEKKAKEALGSDVETLRRQVADLTAKLQNTSQTVARNARDEMKSALTEAIPNWEEINYQQEFKEWLALPDAYSGAIRHTLLRQAWDRNDSRRVLAFFNGFLAEEATGTPQSPKPDLTPAAPGKVPLETLAAPGRAKTTADPGSPVEKPIITRAQIAAFYRDKAAGKYRGREKEADAFEQSIWAAQREGRLQ